MKTIRYFTSHQEAWGFCQGLAFRNDETVTWTQPTFTTTFPQSPWCVVIEHVEE